VWERPRGDGILKDLQGPSLFRCCVLELRCEMRRNLITLPVDEWKAPHLERRMRLSADLFIDKIEGIRCDNCWIWVF
jgi:hypothetical protein